MITHTSHVIYSKAGTELSMTQQQKGEFYTAGPHPSWDQGQQPTGMCS